MSEPNEQPDSEWMPITISVQKKKIDNLESELSALRSQVAELQRQLDEQTKQEPVAWAFEEENGSLYGLALHDHGGIPLYRLPPNLPAMIEQARAEEREMCARIAKLHISSALRIDHSDGLDNSGDIGECYANSTAEDIATAIMARGRND